jgi:hypothetical protein
MKYLLKNKRSWLFFALAAVAVGLLITSSILPWWTCDINAPYGEMGVKPKVEIYQYGLKHNLDQMRDFVIEDETPFLHNVLAWVYIAVSGLMIMLGALIQGRNGRWLLGIAGVGYIVYALVAIYVIVSNRIADFGIELTGWSSSEHHGTVDITVSYYSELGQGYYLAFAAAGLCVLLAVLQPLIAGKARLAE